jgi:hypothetical protein
VFSVFYQHPALIHPDGWKLLDHGDKILVDENTLWLLEKHECEFGYQPKEGTILTCKITPKGKTTPKELEEHWDDMLAYCSEVKGDFAKFVDNAKVEELTDELDDMKVKSDSQPGDLGLASNDHMLENTLASKGQTPPSK